MTQEPSRICLEVSLHVGATLQRAISLKNETFKTLDMRIFQLLSKVSHGVHFSKINPSERLYMERADH